MRYRKKHYDYNLVIKLGIMMLAALLLVGLNEAKGQQFIVDDAAVTTERSFQLETWYGEFESEFIPAVAVTSWLEAGVALAFDTKDNFSLAGYALEAKAVTGDFEELGRAFGLFAGFGFNDSSEFEEFVTYVPYSQLFMNGSSALHLNLGLAFADNGEEWESSIIYGARADWGVHERFTILTEVFAENDDFGFQAGGRFGLIPGLLEMDIMYGRGFEDGFDFPGFTVGVAFTPDSLW